MVVNSITVAHQPVMIPDRIVLSGKQRPKAPQKDQPVPKHPAPDKKNVPADIDMTPAEAIASWKRFKERYVGKVVFFKTGSA